MGGRGAELGAPVAEAILRALGVEPRRLGISGLLLLGGVLAAGTAARRKLPRLEDWNG